MSTGGSAVRRYGAAPGHHSGDRSMVRNSIRYLMLSFVLPLGAFAAASSYAQDYPSLLAAPDRTEADRQNDKKREAEKLLTFIGPRPGWRVLDMAAGAGYSTELMARAVAPGGKVYRQRHDRRGRTATPND